MAKQGAKRMFSVKLPQETITQFDNWSHEFGVRKNEAVLAAFRVLMRAPHDVALAAVRGERCIVRLAPSEEKKILDIPQPVA